MKKLLVSILFCFSVAASNVFSCESIEELDWLIGGWQTENEKNASFENWRQVNNNSLIGIGVQLSTDPKLHTKPPFIEFLRIEVIGGKLFYIAKPPQNELPVAFKATACSEQSVTFENDDHNFPKKITYKRNNLGQLQAIVSGQNEQGFTVNFSNKKVQPEAKLKSVVERYVSAFNQKSLDKMLNLVDENILWMTVTNNQVEIKTQGKTQLSEAMSSYFNADFSTASRLINIQIADDFLIAIEKASWEKSGKILNQCSKVVYQLSSAKINKVWYFPAEACEQTLLSMR